MARPISLSQILRANDSACMLFGLNETELRAGQRNIEQYVGRAWIPLPSSSAATLSSSSVNKLTTTESSTEGSTSASTAIFHVCPDKNEALPLQLRNGSHITSSDDILSPDYVVIDLDSRKSFPDTSANSLIEYYVESKDVLGLPAKSRTLELNDSIVSCTVPKQFDVGLLYKTNIINGRAGNISFLQLLKLCSNYCNYNLLFNGLLIDLFTSKGEIKTTLWIKYLSDGKADTGQCSEKRVGNIKEPNSIGTAGTESNRFLAVFEPVNYICAKLVIDDTGLVMEHSKELEQMLLERQFALYDAMCSDVRCKLNALEETSIHSNKSSTSWGSQSGCVGLKVAEIFPGLLAARQVSTFLLTGIYDV